MAHDVLLLTTYCGLPACFFPGQGPSIYDVHTEGGGRGSGSGGHMWTGEGSSPMLTSTQKMKIRVTNVILFSSHAKKLASVLPEFCL